MYISIADTIVELPGPPEVMSQINVNCLNTHTVSRIRIVVRIGYRAGTVMYRNRCHALAPSILAASYISAEMVWIPARIWAITRGYPFQMLTKITHGNAVAEVDSQHTGSATTLK